MCPPMADNFYLLDCFVISFLAMTRVLVVGKNGLFFITSILALLSLRAQRGNPVDNVARSALTLLFALCALLSEIKNGAFVKTVFRMTARIDVRGRIRSCAAANPN